MAVFDLPDSLEDLPLSLDLLPRSLGDLPEQLDGLPEDIDGLEDVLPPDLNGDNSDLLYLAIGASDAIGVGATPLTNGYVFQIADGLEDAGADVQQVIVGIPGADLAVIAPVAEAALQIGIDPDVVTLWVGANDIIDGVDPQDFEEDLDGLLDQLDGTGAVVAIADIPDLTELPRFREDPVATVTEARIDAFNDAIHDQAEEHGILLVPLSEEPVEDQFVSDVDGFHPNDAGHVRIAELFLAEIEPALSIAGELPLSADADLFS